MKEAMAEINLISEIIHPLMNIILWARIFVHRKHTHEYMHKEFNDITTGREVWQIKDRSAKFHNTAEIFLINRIYEVKNREDGKYQQ